MSKSEIKSLKFLFSCSCETQISPKRTSGLNLGFSQPDLQKYFCFHQPILSLFTEVMTLGQCSSMWSIFIPLLPQFTVQLATEAASKLQVLIPQYENGHTSGAGTDCLLKVLPEGGTFFQSLDPNPPAVGTVSTQRSSLPAASNCFIR